MTYNVVILFEYSSSRKFSLDFMMTRIENFLMEKKYFGFRIKAIELISANIRSLYSTSKISVLNHKLRIEFQNRHLCLVKSII